MKSITVHAGAVTTTGPGVALTAHGAAPIEHWIVEPLVTLKGIIAAL